MTPPTDTPTPRTTELVDRLGNQRKLPNDANASGWSSLDTYAFIDFARTLERENQQLQQELVERTEQLKIALVSGNHFKQLASDWQKMAEGFRYYTSCKKTCDGMHYSNHPCNCGLQSRESHFHSLQQQMKDE